ncbi:MAG: hypothetical protein AB1414_00295 [bacterium]
MKQIDSTKDISTISSTYPSAGEKKEKSEISPPKKPFATFIKKEDTQLPVSNLKTISHTNIGHLSQSPEFDKKKQISTPQINQEAVILGQIMPAILTKPPEVVQAPSPSLTKLSLDQILPPQEIDKIVQSVRVGTNELGRTEFQFDLKTEILGGLKLKISNSQEGKVSISFITNSDDIQNLIESNKTLLENNFIKRGLMIEQIFIGPSHSGKDSSSYDEKKQHSPEIETSSDDISIKRVRKKEYISIYPGSNNTRDYTV